MSSITATLFIGTADSYDSGIQPTHTIQITEGHRIALHLSSFQSDRHVKSFTELATGEPIVMIPTVERLVDDIYLMIGTYILRKVAPDKPLHSNKRTSMYDLFTEDEREGLYLQARASLEDVHMKVVFHLLDNCHLLHLMDQIETYPCDFEITKTVRKREFSMWAKKVITTSY